jgi:hypothetical protein
MTEKNNVLIAKEEVTLAEIEHDLARIDSRIKEISLGGTTTEPDEIRRAFTRKRHLLHEQLNVRMTLIELNRGVSFEDDDFGGRLNEDR